MSGPGESTLTASGVRVAFEGLVALDDVDFSARQGEILGLIGPNGAGKSTLLNAISGFVRLSAGRVVLDGRDITHVPAHRRPHVGVGRSFQAARLFRGLSVRENVEAGVVAGGAGRRESLRRSGALLAHAGLTAKAETPAGTLPAGEQLRVGILRALSVRPRFLLLDEPAAGLNEAESDDLVRWIRLVRDDFECAVVVIDHDMRVIMPLCESIHVLNEGRTICVGDPSVVRADPAVLEAYLGAGGDEDVQALLSDDGGES